MSTSFRCYVMGGESLAIQCTEILLARGHAVLGMISSDPAITRWAAQKGLAVLAPGRDTLAERLRERGEPFDWLFSIANLELISPEALALPRAGAINFHDGPLPRYAGLNAPSWAILNGEREHGIAWHMIEPGIDEGDVVLRRSFELRPGDTSVIANTRCYELAIESFEELTSRIERGALEREPQDASERTYYGRFERPPAMCVIDWSKPASEIAALARALDFGPRYANPLGLPKTFAGESAIVLLDPTELEAARAASPGTVLALDDSGISVACGDGSLRFGRVMDLEGRRLDRAALERLGLRGGAELQRLPDTQARALSELDEQLARHERFWAERLAALSPIALPAVSHPGDAEPGPRSEGQAGEIRAELELPDAGAGGALAIALAWLARSSGALAFDVGYQHAGIPSLGAPGALVASAVPLSIELERDTSFGALRDRATASRERVRARLSYPRELCVRRPGLSVPRFDVLISEGEPLGAPADLMISIAPDGRRLTVIARTARLDADAVGRIRSQLDAIATAAIAGRDRAVLELPLLSDGERDRILGELSGEPGETPSRPDERCVHELIEAQIDRSPEAVALTFGGASLTYRELDRRANQLAHHLISLGVGPDMPVALLLPRSPELVIAALAIWKAGGAYVPVDPDYPRDRIALYLEDSIGSLTGARVVVTDRARAEELAIEGVTIVDLDRDAEELSRRPSERPARPLSASSLAYLIYTSGSTGRPKGVMVEHRNVAAFFDSMDPVIERDARSSWLAITSLSFDISVLELFYTLARGIRVVLARTEDRVNLSSGRVPRSRPLGMSLFYFASDEGEPGQAQSKYKLLLQGARFADEHGFEAVWTPERHFNAFGGLYPNPSVASAAIAAITKRVKIRAGSCVLPLHHPVRVAEEWALVDNLSQGRVGISFASGWHPNDFVLRPESFANARGVMARDIEVVRKLWRGEAVELEGPKGKVTVRTLPRPVQPELPVWITAAGNPDTFAAAGRSGAGILTHLLGQSFEEVAPKIAAYREAWKEAGHPGEGHVTLMLHTFIGEDEAAVKETVREPMKAYLRSSLQLIAQHAWSFPAWKRVAKEDASFEDNFSSLSPEDTDALLEHSFERYYQSSGLFGTPESCSRVVDRCAAIGVDEIACLIDFGVDSETVLAHLPQLDALRARAQEDDDSLAARITRERITHLQCTPSMLRMLLGDPATRAALGGIEHLYVGGEALPSALVRELAAISEASVTNMYGPTETTVWSSTERARAGEGLAVVSIGRPLARERMYVLDAQMQPAPIGVAGELWIGGAGVARGYWNREDITAERFVADPFAGRGARMYRTGDRARWMADGRLEFLGRVDHQVKIRGHRIELGEIEARLSAHADVRDAAVIARQLDGDARLIAYYTAASGAHPDPERLRDHLRALLPEPMVPARYVELAEMPLTPNRKVDRSRLPEPGAEETVAARPSAEHVEAAGDLQRRIAEIWSRILGVSRVGAHDNFFDLGGHSLLAVRAHREIRETLGKDLTITDIFRFPTISALASHLGDDDNDRASLAAAADRAATRREARAMRGAARRR